MAKGESAMELTPERRDGWVRTTPKEPKRISLLSLGHMDLKADLDWEGLFTQGGLLQQGHQNQPTNIYRSYMFLDQQLEDGA